MRSASVDTSATPTLAKHIEHWPISRLIPYTRNARTHSDAQVAQIAASIREFGFTNPILVDTGDGIIAGHGRLLAARLLKLETVPVIVLDHLTETQKRAYIIADIHDKYLSRETEVPPGSRSRLLVAFNLPKEVGVAARVGFSAGSLHGAEPDIHLRYRAPFTVTED